MLLALSGLTDRPQHLLTVGLVRARLCELLAGAHPVAATDRAFTVGLFSVVDALLGKPMQALLDELPFDSRIRHALLDHDGPEGRLLAAVLAYERGDFNDVPRFGVGLPALAARTARRSTGPTASPSSWSPELADQRERQVRRAVAGLVDRQLALRADVDARAAGDRLLERDLLELRRRSRSPAR